MQLCPNCDAVYKNDNQRFCPNDGGILGSLKILNDRYEIMAEIGRGGMGAVYQAKDKKLARECAIKVIYTSVPQDEKEKQASDVLTTRFQNEARLAAQIAHPNVVSVYEFGVTKNGLYFLVMEHLLGETLRELLKREKVLPLNRIIPIVKQCVDALIETHSKNIVHRDLKPENIFVINLNGQEKVKILDFGIAKAFDDKRMDLTKTGIIMGSPTYISPEQVKGEKDLDSQSDLYSLALITYEMLTGRLPFQGKTPNDLLVERLSKDPMPPSQANPQAAISPELDRALLKALARDRALRTISVKEFFTELLQAVQSNQPQVDSDYEIGLEHYHKGNYINAIEKLSSTLKTSADVFYLRGLASFDQGEYKEALADFSQAAKLDPKETYYYYCGLAFYELGDYVQAAKSLTQAIQANSTYSYYYYIRGKSHFYQGQGNYPQAIENFQLVLQLDPEDASSYYYLGRINYLSKDYLQAIASFNKAIKLSPQDSINYHQCGLAYLHLGNRKQATEYFQFAFKLKKDPSLRELLKRLS